MAYRTRGPAFGMSFSLTPWVKRLLIANVAVFLLASAGLGGLFVRWFAFYPMDILFQPWGVFTYMFLHDGTWHLLVNMIGLFFFGPPLESRWGSSGFIRYYVICALGGAALSFLFTPGAYIVGASAAVYGLLLAFAMNWPNAPIYLYGVFPVPAKWFVAALFVLSFLGAGGEGIAHMAHLGGLITGFIYLKSDWRPGAAIDRWKRESRKRSLVVVSGKKNDGEKSRASTRTRRSDEEEQLLDAVDRVLDKISAEGMSSLTEEERKLLDEMSKRHRTH